MCYPVLNTSSSNAYTLFKHKFELENYLLKLPHTLRKHLCLFRTRNHRLPVERGRWLNITTSDRKCHFCNSDVGDEFHALLKCPFFSIERRRFIKPYFYKRPNIIKFDELMNTNNTAALKKLAKFVRVIMKQPMNQIKEEHQDTIHSHLPTPPPPPHPNAYARPTTQSIHAYLPQSRLQYLHCTMHPAQMGYPVQRHLHDFTK